MALFVCFVVTMPVWTGMPAHKSTAFASAAVCAGGWPCAGRVRAVCAPCARRVRWWVAARAWANPARGLQSPPRWWCFAKVSQPFPVGLARCSPRGSNPSRRPRRGATQPAPLEVRGRLTELSSDANAGECAYRLTPRLWILPCPAGRSIPPYPGCRGSQVSAIYLPTRSVVGRCTSAGCGIYAASWSSPSAPRSSTSEHGHGPWVWGGVWVGGVWAAMLICAAVGGGAC